tara:strand:- start:1337 stop:1519 length:183 start_codon:yes stop_codon:yes gene_type:complete
MAKQTIFKVVNENGTFEGENLYKVLLKSKAEFSKEYVIYKNDVLFDSIKRDLDKNGQIIR